MAHKIHHHEQCRLIETRCGSCHNLEISWGARALGELAQKQSAAAQACKMSICMMTRAATADSSLPIAAYLDDDPMVVHPVKKCAANCCGGDEGVLLKKYEHNNQFHNA